MGGIPLWFLLAGCGDAVTATVPRPVGPPHEVEIHQAYQQLGLNTSERDIHGQPQRAPCGSCHHLVGPEDENAFAMELRGFHRGVNLHHGDNTCRTCHAPPDFERFSLASGRTVDYAGVVQLCAQCHAGQWRDYQQGLHGGMSGHWDLAAGPQVRNSCVDCHSAHAPAIPSVMPAARSQPRFLGGAHE